MSKEFTTNPLRSGPKEFTVNMKRNIKKVPKRVKGKKEVHRDLQLVSPFMKGSDVRALQQAIKKEFKHYKIDWIPVKVDGELGKQTINATHFLGWVIGFEQTVERRIKKGIIRKEDQYKIRNSRKRTFGNRSLSKSRQPKLKSIRKRHHEGATAAVKWAESKVGTTESPAGSNSGPGISEWEAYWGLGACYWCGVFAGYAVKQIGHAKVDSWLPYGPSIINDARAHQNGLIAVDPKDAKPGDLVVYWGGEHIGLIRKKPSKGRVITVEGNTSSSTGSQSNGGGVFLKERSFSDVTVIARPSY